MPTWIPSAEAFGTPKLTRSVQPTSVPSAEAFGTASVVTLVVTLVQPTGIPTGEAEGTPTEVLVLGPTGIPSGQAVPVPFVKTTVTPILVSGTATGFGILAIPLVELSGPILGAATMTGDVALVFRVAGIARGAGSLSWTGPWPFLGLSTMVGEMVVEQAPPPVCGCRVPQPVTTRRCACGGTIVVPSDVICTCSTLTGGDGFGAGGPFRWMQPFQPGDLQLFLRDSAGPVAPVSVSYTLYWIRNGIPYQAGPANRVPARGPNVGQYYVTGTAGAFGQPGTWMVRWYYQRNFFSEIQSVDYRFTVQDAVAAADPRDTTVRYLKYGWD